MLISKDVGGLRWSVVYEPPAFLGTTDRHLGRLTGNVFDPAGGPPRFVACEGINGGTAENRFDCFGADACGCAPCASTAWTPITGVALPRSFFAGRRCPDDGAPPPGLVASLRPSEDEDANGFGSLLALDGTTAVVAVPDAALYVFEREAAGWRQAARFASTSPPGKESDVHFAGSVALQGATLFASDRDRVRVWQRSGSLWTSAGSFAPGSARSVTVAASAPGAVVVLVRDEQGRGVLRIYEGAGGSWSPTAEIAPPGEKPFERFRTAAIADGKAAFTIASSFSSGGAPTSAVYVYERSGPEWVESARIEDAKLDVSAFGEALALSGDTLLIGSPPRGGNFDTRSHDGVAYVWQRSDEGWHEVAALRTCAPDVGRFGSMVALSGDVAAIAGADFSDGGAAGDVYLFEREGGPWREVGRIPVTVAASQSARSLALSGTTLLAPGDGEVGVFDVASPDVLSPEPCRAPAPQLWPSDGWRVDDPTAHGMNPVLLERAREYALQPAKHTQGVVVVRHGAIVAEWYEDGRDATSYAGSWSNAKSIASAVIGIALDCGVLPDVDVPLANYFPEWRGDDRAGITLRHALTMSSGLSWTENYSVVQTELSDIAVLASQVGDDLAYVLGKPLASPPGTVWSYSSADTMLLSGALQAALGRTLGDYAREVLFEPIGMTSAEWWTDAVGRTLSWCCVDAPTREFARFGLLYARGGRWGDRQVVPAAWVRDSGRPLSFREGEDDIQPGYGYQWWLGVRDFHRYTADAIEARGFDAQHIYVFPSLDLVIVRNGHHDKHPGPPVADPNLFALYPAGGLGNGRGTIPPDVWDESLFLRAIVQSIVE